MKQKWSSKWPTTEGFYWFFGWPYGEKNEDPELCVIRVVRAGSSVIQNQFLMYIREGHFWEKSEGAIGKFTPITKPELPKDIT